MFLFPLIIAIKGDGEAGLIAIKNDALVILNIIGSTIIFAGTIYVLTCIYNKQQQQSLVIVSLIVLVLVLGILNLVMTT